jgi:hypothetical protein
MVDLSSFFRIRENNLEIFIQGLSLAFTEAVRTGSLGIIENWKARSNWVQCRVREYTKHHDLQNLNIVLDCRMDNIYTAKLGVEIVFEFGIPKEKVLFLVSVTNTEFLEQFDFTYKIDTLAALNYCYFYDELSKENIDWANIAIDRPILSLASRPTEDRAITTKGLLDLAGERCRASFGITDHYPMSEKENRMYQNIMHPYSIPLRYGTDEKTTSEIRLQHNPPGQQLYRSLVTVVNETNDNQHTGIFLTEKTFKAFAWHQIPIFVATSGHVQVVRELGFDMFDDILDHSYNKSVFTPHIHRMKVLTVVAKFLREYPMIEDIQLLRKKLWPRLVANNNRLLDLNKVKTIEPWPYYC